MGSAIHPGEAIETDHYQLYVLQQPERMENISKNKKIHYILIKHCVSAQKA